MSLVNENFSTLQLGYIKHEENKIFTSAYTTEPSHFIKEPKGEANTDHNMRFESNFQEIAGEKLIISFGLEGLNREIVNLSHTTAVKMKAVEGSFDNLQNCEIKNLENSLDVPTILLLLTWVGAGDHGLEAGRNFGFTTSVTDNIKYRILIIDLEHWFSGARLDNYEEKEPSKELAKNFFPEKFFIKDPIKIIKTIENMRSIKIQQILTEAFNQVLQGSEKEKLNLPILWKILESKILFLERRKTKVAEVFQSIISDPLFTPSPSPTFL